MTRFESEVERVVKIIERTPSIFPAYDAEHRYAMLKRFPYTLVFQTPVEGIQIVAVAHTSRRSGYWQGRR
jgi:toxin ParE1/3/4